MIKDVIAKLLQKKALTQQEAYGSMKEIMAGQATPSQIAGFLIALRCKEETVEEIAGCALAMRDAATPLTLNHHLLLDSCGTGGDGQCGLNVSTAAAFVVAGAGYRVAKHGNRSISSKCGSADVLELLGVRVDPPSAVVEQCIDQIGIGFMFAPSFHQAMKHAMPTRKELGVRTVFNLLGPLTNPAKARVQLIGVYHKNLAGKMAQALARMGHVAGLVVHSHGWDEITLEKKTDVVEMFKGKIRRYAWTAKDFGLPKVPAYQLRAESGQQSADMIVEILEKKNIPARPVVVANAAALIWIAERANGKKPFSLKEAVKRAEDAIDSGRAMEKLGALADLSHNIE